ncbi:hypothetical protein [Halovivax limisalsi]|uniref:hypothetical protein n=1 Tax=Halovivax limisalsi TaxID=1453760 RepID=UPI001FFD948E|nr:hypothetical protein [Halovivax limisalsi]
MTATGRSAEATPAAVESAGFVQLLARPDGDALAAAGVLARALDARETPFQVSVCERADRASRVATDADTVTVALGPIDVPSSSDGSVVSIDPAHGSLTGQAVELADALDVDVDPGLALAGTVAAGTATPDADPLAELVDIARETGVLDRRPGVAIPTDDPVDGLAHATLVRAAWSGDADAAATATGDAEGRQLASVVAIDAIGCDGASARAAETIDRVLHPDTTPDGPFATVGGLADVLTATARTAPGIGVTLAYGRDVTDVALEAWRTHGEAVHAALDAATTARHDGVFVCRLDDEAPDLARTDAIETVAGLAAATMTPEPVVLAVGDDRIGLATADGTPAAIHCDAVAASHEVVADAGHRTGTLYPGEPTDPVDGASHPTDDGVDQPTDDAFDAAIDVDAVIETVRAES